MTTSTHQMKGLFLNRYPYLQGFLGFRNSFTILGGKGGSKLTFNVLLFTSSSFVSHLEITLKIQFYIVSERINKQLIIVHIIKYHKYLFSRAFSFPFL